MIHWYDSQRFKAYVSSELLIIFGWLTENISTKGFSLSKWSWIAITISTLSLLSAVVKDWASPAIVAPFAVLNQNNAVTVPASSVRDAEKKSGT